jgi:hypothetical protein
MDMHKIRSILIQNPVKTLLDLSIIVGVRIRAGRDKVAYDSKDGDPLPFPLRQPILFLSRSANAVKDPYFMPLRNQMFS